MRVLHNGVLSIYMQANIIDIIEWLSYARLVADARGGLSTLSVNSGLSHPFYYVATVLSIYIVIL